MIRIAVLGDIDSIKGFGAVGLDVFPCTDQQSAHDSFKKITGRTPKEYRLLFAGPTTLRGDPNGT